MLGARTTGQACDQANADTDTHTPLTSMQTRNHWCLNEYDRCGTQTLTLCIHITILNWAKTIWHVCQWYTIHTSSPATAGAGASTIVEKRSPWLHAQFDLHFVLHDVLQSAESLHLTMHLASVHPLLLVQVPESTQTANQTWAVHSYDWALWLYINTWQFWQEVGLIGM